MPWDPWWLQIVAVCCQHWGNNIPHAEKTIFHFLSYWNGYDRGDSFPSDFEPNGIPFGSKSKRKLPPRSYPIQCEKEGKYSFVSVVASGIWLMIGEGVIYFVSVPSIYVFFVRLSFFLCALEISSFCAWICFFLRLNFLPRKEKSA